MLSLEAHNQTSCFPNCLNKRYLLEPVRATRIWNGKILIDFEALQVASLHYPKDIFSWAANTRASAEKEVIRFAIWAREELRLCALHVDIIIVFPTTIHFRIFSN